jgi:hypothetical protein
MNVFKKVFRRKRAARLRALRIETIGTVEQALKNAARTMPAQGKKEYLAAVELWASSRRQNTFSLETRKAVQTIIAALPVEGKHSKYFKFLKAVVDGHAGGI